VDAAGDRLGGRAPARPSTGIGHSEHEVDDRSGWVAKVKRNRFDGLEADSVGLYMDGLGRWELLTKDDEARLGALIEQGAAARARLEGPGKLTAEERRTARALVRAGQEATEQFVHANLRLVISIARRYQSSGMPLADLIQEGNLGLMHAVEKFDWRKGFKFSTYATWWIKQSITRGIANQERTIRLPVHAGDIVTLLTKTSSRLEGSLGRRPTVEELAHESGLSPAQVEDTQRWMQDTTSLDQPIGSEGDLSLGDRVADANEDPAGDVIAADTVNQISRMLGRLDDRERRILTLRYGLDGGGEPRTLEDVSSHFDLTRERIRQIEVKAMCKLRHPSAASEGMQDLLGA